MTRAYLEEYLDVKLTNQDFWDNGYAGQKFSAEDLNYPIVKKLYDFFDKDEFQDKTVFEIGCFPGRFLYHFGKIGFKLNGIDQTQYLSKMMAWFEKENFLIGDFVREDIFNLDLNHKKYDVVFSSGFIEHFRNFDEVIKIHVKLVKDDGYVFISTQNFAGSAQSFLHSFLDKENLKAHYLPSMDYQKWKNIFARIITKIIRIIFGWRFLPNSQIYSPEIFIIAKKKTK